MASQLWNGKFWCWICLKVLAVMAASVGFLMTIERDSHFIFGFRVKYGWELFVSYFKNMLTGSLQVKCADRQYSMTFFPLYARVHNMVAGADHYNLLQLPRYLWNIYRNRFFFFFFAWEVLAVQLDPLFSLVGCASWLWKAAAHRQLCLFGSLLAGQSLL